MRRPNPAFSGQRRPNRGSTKGQKGHSDPLSALRQARYRARQKAGKIVVQVEVDREILNFLVERARWLTDSEAEDANRIGQAITKGLKLSARS